MQQQNGSFLKVLLLGTKPKRQQRKPEHIETTKQMKNKREPVCSAPSTRSCRCQFDYQYIFAHHIRRDSDFWPSTTRTTPVILKGKIAQNFLPNFVSTPCVMSPIFNVIGRGTCSTHLKTSQNIQTTWKSTCFLNRNTIFIPMLARKQRSILRIWRQKDRIKFSANVALYHVAAPMLMKIGHVTQNMSKHTKDTGMYLLAQHKHHIHKDISLTIDTARKQRSILRVWRQKDCVKLSADFVSRHVADVDLLGPHILEYFEGSRHRHVFDFDALLRNNFGTFLRVFAMFGRSELITLQNAHDWPLKHVHMYSFPMSKNIWRTWSGIQIVVAVSYQYAIRICESLCCKIIRICWIFFSLNVCIHEARWASKGLCVLHVHPSRGQTNIWEVSQECDVDLRKSRTPTPPPPGWRVDKLMPHFNKNRPGMCCSARTAACVLIMCVCVWAFFLGFEKVSKAVQSS